MDLCWLALIVVVFVVARSPVFDIIFRPWQPTQVIVLKNYSRASSVTNPEVVKLRFRDLQTVEVIPLAVGFSLIEFATDSELETFIVNIEKNFHAEVVRIENQNRICNVLEDHPDWDFRIQNRDNINNGVLSTDKR